MNTTASISHVYFSSTASITMSLHVEKKTEVRTAAVGVSAEALLISNVVINCVLNNVLCPLGIVGNILNIIVLSSPKFRDTTSFLLLCLSVIDLLVSTTLWIYRLPYVIKYFDPYLGNVVDCFYRTYIYVWNHNFLYTSIFDVSLVAVERMIAVCFPFQVAGLITMTRMRVLAFIGFIFYPILASPFLNMFNTITFKDRNNATIVLLTYSNFFLDNFKIFYVYGIVVAMLFIFVGPMVVITVCTLMITYTMALNRSSLGKLSSTNLSKQLREMKSAKVVLIVCLSMMTLIIIPAMIFDLLNWFQADFRSDSNRYEIIVNVIVIVGQLNSFFNFIIYVATSSKFSREFKLLFHLNCNNKKKKNCVK